MRILIAVLTLCVAAGVQAQMKVSEFVELRQEITTAYTLQHPGATFIKVRLQVAGKTVVRNPAGTEAYRYSPGQKDKHTKHGQDLGAMSILGDTVIIEVQAGKATLIGYDAGLPMQEWHAIGAPENTCGMDDSRPVRCYEQSQPALFERRRPVARIYMANSGSLCTAFRVGAGNKMMTNAHCTATPEGVAASEVWFAYETPTCDGGTPSWYKLPAETLLVANGTFDVTLFTVQATAELQFYGYLGLDVGLAQVGDPIAMIGHPGGKPLMMMVDSDRNASGKCEIDDVHYNGFAPDSDYGYYCDSAGGQSGSPVINRNTGRAIGLHHLGGCQPTTSGTNAGVKMARIWPLISTHFNGVPPIGSNEAPIIDPPLAVPQVTCTDNICQYSSVGTVGVPFWDFGDGTTSADPQGTHTYLEPGHKAVTLFATLNTVTASTSVVVHVIVPGYDARPWANFTCSVTDLTIACDSTSYDPEGPIVAWFWRFFDPLDNIFHTYQTENASHTFLMAGPNKYVDLTVNDAIGQSSYTYFAYIDLAAPPPNPCGNGVCDAGETYASCPADCPPPPAPITLTYTARKVQGPNWNITYKWSGAVGDTVKLYRASTPTTTANDGSEMYPAHNRDKGFSAKVCDATQCSRTITVTW